MSKNVSRLENPLLEEEEYNGRLFQLSLPDTAGIDYSWLEGELDGRSVTLETNIDQDDLDDLHIPPVFQSAIEDETQIGSFQNITEFSQENITGVMGYISHNKSNTVKFDDKEVLIFDEKLTRFLIFESHGEAFLLILSSRDTLTMLYNMITEELADLGFVADEIKISHDEFDEIADVLIDTHQQTAVEGYEENSIHKKLIIGRNYGDTREYHREKQQGTVHGQRFGTSQLDGSSKTVQLSYDCLIRSYHKITLSMYLLMVTSYIIPSLSLSAQASLSWYGSETAVPQTKQITDD